MSTIIKNDRIVSRSFMLLRKMTENVESIDEKRH